MGNWRSARAGTPDGDKVAANNDDAEPGRKRDRKRARTSLAHSRFRVLLPSLRPWIVSRSILIR